MKVGTITYSNQTPERFSVVDLKSYKVITICENPEEVLFQNGLQDKENAIQVRFEMYSDRFYRITYEELVSAFIGLKYSTGDEIALMRKAMRSEDHEEVEEYLQFVEDVKVFARENT